jgi:hypothetical protein
MQAFNSLLRHFDLAFGVPVIAIALVLGALAGMWTWLDGPSEGLLRIGREQGFLPPYFQKVSSKGIEVRIIALQGAVITVIALLYAFIPGVSQAYWIFAAMATQVYLIMYVLMFIAAMRLRRSQPDRVRDRVRPSGAVRPLKPAPVLLLDPGRHSGRRDSAAASDGPIPQAGLEGSRPRRQSRHADLTAAQVTRPDAAAKQGAVLRGELSLIGAVGPRVASGSVSYGVIMCVTSGSARG